jgi:hypothetical protein
MRELYHPCSSVRAYHSLEYDDEVRLVGVVY